MWPFPKEISEHLKWVREQRRAGAGGGDDDDDDDD